MPRRTWPRFSRLAIGLALLGCRDSPDLTVSSAGAQSARVAEAQTVVDASRRTALVAAADRASPAVVSINVTSRQQAAPRTPWDFFFVPEGARLVQGYGTGFVIRPQGIVLTNQHV